MPKERRKIIQAGRLWMAVQYTAIRSGDQEARRETRSQISSPARESLNAKLSWQKLMLSLAANFAPSDLVVTLSYRDDSLPIRREEADKRLSNFIRALRKYRFERCQTLIYVRVTEGYHAGGRLHHHLIVNSTGDDYASIRSLWQKNGDNVEFSLFGNDGAERWGKYLTKEPREQGRRHVGDRSWRSSVGLKKPLVSYAYVSQDEPLSPPKGSFILDRTQCENCYGRFCHVVAMLPERTIE